MKKFIIAVLFISILWAADTKNFGEDLTLKETTAISTILESPEKYVDQKVMVEGRVLDVCKKRGCWITVSSDKDFESIMVKVEDGVIVFPQESKGKMARVEGVIEKIEFSMEETLAKEKHECEKEGKEFDASKVTKPDVMYRLKATGAAIEM
ncbi:MAG: DUF4920 domain-containing protein [Calditrichae bacterium]|nr:DUF4920 domain-containing protein [Calditrichota bacterium]MCB9058603.1 DUF4920 domain-containing protein [Calditrichia bacterium]